MDMDRIRELHESGHHSTAAKRFSEMCAERMHERYAVPESVSHLVHYTTLEALFSMLGSKLEKRNPIVMSSQENNGGTSKQASQGFLRLYDTFFSNDPNEGGFFVNSVDKSNPFREQYRALWSLIERRSASPAYMTSLVCVEDLSEIEDLVFWRTYGINGSGCALAFPIGSVRDHPALYQVRYGEDEVQECLREFCEMLDAYVSIDGAEQIQSLESFAELPHKLSSVFSPLVYLHKSNFYKYEKEARIVVPYSDIAGRIYLDVPHMDSSPATWRHFAELPDLKIRELLVSPSSITLGPTVESPANAQFVLQRLLHELEIYGPTVEISSISYRS